jgi:hypothetical protein
MLSFPTRVNVPEFEKTPFTVMAVAPFRVTEAPGSMMRPFAVTVDPPPFPVFAVTMGYSGALEIRTFAVVGGPPAIVGVQLFPSFQFVLLEPFHV